MTANAADTTTRRASLRLVDISGTLTPAAARDLLSPLAGRTFGPYKGWTWLGAEPELVPLGDFVITSVEAETTQGGTTITLGGEDASRKIADNKFVESADPLLPPGYVAAGIDIATAIERIALDRLPGLVTHTVLSGFVTSRTVPSLNSSPWALMQTFATSIGYRLLFDGDGGLHIEPVPDPAASGAVPVWHYVDDSTKGDPVVRKLNTTATRDGVFSGAVAIGQNTYGLTPPRAVVWDDDPQSPTYYKGPFGMVPDDMPPDEKLLTKPQAVASATGNLNKKKGLPQVLSIDQYVNPALTPDDIVQVDMERSNTQGLYVFDRTEVTFALSDSMQVTARERRFVA